jgi:hypothetical protein
LDDRHEFIDPKSLPIYQKGEEIFEVVHQLSKLIPEDDEMLQSTKGYMLSDAALLTVKVAGASGAAFYDLKMENATIIRKAARELILHNHSLEAFGFEEVEYFQIVRDLVEEYRLL